MPQEKPEPDRIRDLEDALKEAERRVAEMRAERDQAFELVEQMKEHVSDVDALIDSWIEAFEMQLSEDGKRTRDAQPESNNFARACSGRVRKRRFDVDIRKGRKRCPLNCSKNTQSAARFSLYFQYSWRSHVEL